MARGLLDRTRAAADVTPPGAMAAVVLCNLAVETAAKATLADRGRRPTSPVAAMRHRKVSSGSQRRAARSWGRSSTSYSRSIASVKGPETDGPPGTCGARC